MAVIIRDRSSGTVYSSADKTGRKEEKPRAGGVIITDRATGRTYGSDPSLESPAMALAREAAAERENPNGYVGMADINREARTPVYGAVGKGTAVPGAPGGGGRGTTPAKTGWDYVGQQQRAMGDIRAERVDSAVKFAGDALDVFQGGLQTPLSTLDKAGYWLGVKLGITDPNDKYQYDMAHAYDKDMQTTTERANEGRSAIGQKAMEAFGAAGNVIGSTLFAYATGIPQAASTALSPMASSLAPAEAELGATAAQKTLAAGSRFAGNLLGDLAASPTNAVISAQSGINAYDQAKTAGASDNDAFAAGLGSAALEYYSNKLFSGTPLLDSPEEKGYVVELIEDVARKAGKSDFVKKLFGNGFVNFLFDRFGEGMEETVTRFFDPLIERLTYNRDADLATASELFDAFTGGVALSLLLGAGESVTGFRARRGEAFADQLQSKQAELLPAPQQTQAEAQKTIASEASAKQNAENSRLTEADEDEYLRVGQKLHVRDQKARQVEESGSAILTSPKQIVEYIRGALSGTISNSIKGYGKVGTRLADIVSKVTGGEIDISNYYLELNANQLAHLSDHIVTDKDVRNIPLTAKQVERLPDYIDTYDDLIDVIRRKDGSVRLMLGKRINGHSIIIEAVSKGRSSLHPVTAYKLPSEDYDKYYKTKAIDRKYKEATDRSSTSRPANADTVDISRQAVASVGTIPQPMQSVNLAQQVEAPDAPAQLGIDPKGKSPSELRAEIRAAMAALNEQRRQANAGMIRQYAEGEYAAGRMTENGVRIINDFYDGSVAPSVYIQGMTAAYNAGARGADVKSVDTSALTDLQRDAAYLAGQAAGRKANIEGPNIDAVQRYVQNETDAGRMGENGARMLQSYYDPSRSSAEKYVHAAAAAYNAGVSGGDVNTVSSPVLTQAQRDAAYMAGQADARQGQTVLAQANIPAAQQTATQPTAQGQQVTAQTQTARAGQQPAAVAQKTAGQQTSAQPTQETANTGPKQKAAETKKTAPVRAENPGLVQDDKTAKAKLTRRESRALDALGKVLGKKIQFVDSLTAEIVDADGNVRRSGANAEIEGDTIRIALDSDDPFLTAAVHEVVHGIRDLDEASYQALAKFVANNMSDQYRKVAEWEEASKGYTAEQIPEEIVCDAFGRMLGDEAKLQQFVHDDRTAAQKLFDALHDLLVKVQRALSGGGQKLTDNQRAVYSELEGRLETMLFLFGKALNNVSGAEGETNGSVKYSNKAEVLALPNVDWVGEKVSIKQQLRNHSSELDAMEPVAVVDFKSIPNGKLVEKILYEVSRVGGGLMKRDGVTFQFDEEGAKRIDTHARYAELQAATLASPYVAKYGRLISGQKNHEGTGLTTLTFGAPAIINGQRVNVGVVIQFQANGSPRAVNVGLQSGKPFKINIEASKGPDSRVERYVPGTSLPTKDASEKDATTKPGQSQGKKHSLKSTMATLNLHDEVRDGKRVWVDENGNVVTMITPKMVRSTGIGALIDVASAEWKDDDGNVIKPASISQKEADKQVAAFDFSGEQTIPEINRNAVRAVANDPAALAQFGIDAKGKTPSQVRAEIRAAMAAQNEQRRQANAGMIRQYAEGEYAAGRMTENGVRIINDFYDGSVAPSAYIRGMTAAYNAGAKGADVKSVDTSALTDLQRDAAYLAGQAAGRKGQTKAAQTTVPERPAQAVKPGLNAESAAKAKLTRKETRMLDALGKILGAEVRFVDEITDENGKSSAGQGKYRNGVIEIKYGASDPVTTIAVHEAVHRVRELSPEAYDALQKYVQKHLGDKKTAKSEALREVAYAPGTDLTEEVVADAFGVALSDADFINGLVAENRSAAQKLLDALNDILVKVRRMMNGTNAKLSPEQRAEFAELARKLDVTQTKFRDALREAGQAAQGEALLDAELSRGETLNAKFSKPSKWRTGWSKKDVIVLEKALQYDISVSNRRITDTANWYYTEKNGEPVFAIYSTEDINPPTILYASRGETARNDMRIINDFLGRYSDGPNITGEDFSRLLEVPWGEQDASPVYGGDALHAGDAGRNAAVHQGAQRRKPGDALRNVLRDLEQEQDGGQRELTDSQRKNYDYNQQQTETGSTLRTLGLPGKNGSQIKRSKYGVGKDIGGTIYLHRDYATDVIPADVYESALQTLQEDYPDFQFNCVEYNPKDGTVRFDEAPGFDTEREPVVGDYVRVNADGTTKQGHMEYIWHHKWLWVRDDYKGFNVRDAWEWSKRWLSTVSGKTYDVNGKAYNDRATSDGNGIERWNAQLEAYGLPLDSRGKYSMSTKELLRQQAEQYGEMKKGEKPRRDVTIPKRTTPKTKVGQTIRTIAEAPVTPEKLVPTVEELVANGEFDYSPYGDEAALAAQYELWRQANAGMIRQYAEGEYAAGRMTENGVRIFSDFYDGSSTPSAYIQGMTAAYNAGANGTNVKSVNTYALTDLQRDAAYLAGQAAGRKATAEQPRIETVRSFTETEQAEGRMSEEGARIIRDYYDPSRSNAEDYVEAAAAAYNAGVTGADVNSVSSPVLTRSQRDAAYMAGRAAARQGVTAQASVQAPQASVSHQQTIPAAQPAETTKPPSVRAANPGLVRDENFAKSKITNRTARVLDALGRVTGRKIQFVESLSAEIVDDDGNVRKSGANAEIEGDTIRIALDSDDPFLVAAFHEVVHGIRDLDEEAYQSLAKFVTSNMTDQKYGVAQWEEGRKGYTADQIPEEIVCDAFGRMLGDEAKLQQFVKENTTAAERFMDALRDLLDKVRQVLTGDRREANTLTANQRAVYKDFEDRLDKMLLLFEEALNAVKESENTERRESKQYALKGKNVFGDEVYETKEEIKSMTYAEKIDRFKQNFYDPDSPHYIGQRVRFQKKDGSFYFAEINRHTQKENTGKMNPNRLYKTDKAKINIGAEGDFVTLLNNARITSEGNPITNRNTDAKKHADSMDYALKNVVVDGVPYKEVVNITQESPNHYVYEMKLLRNNERPLNDPQLTEIVDERRSLGNKSPNRSRNPKVTESGKNVKRNSRRRYSLKAVEPVEPSSDRWERGATYDEVKAAHPTLYELTADENESRNPTQVTVTQKSYRKIYSALQDEGFDGTILDASSGLGLGTEVGRKEFGYDVEDIEPFPDKSYKPMYTDYSTLDKTYDVIISNAVLNVLPQDLRDDLTVKIGEMLKPGGAGAARNRSQR